MPIDQPTGAWGSKMLVLPVVQQFSIREPYAGYL
jgi:hypothetical protein